MRRLRAFRPACAVLEGRIVLSGSAAAVASAGGPGGNVAALAAFAQQVRQGQAPTLTVDFGTPSDASPAGTIVMPAASYSPGLGYGWISDPGEVKVRGGVATGRSGDFEIDVPPGTYDVTVTPQAARDHDLNSLVTAFAAGDATGGPGAFFSDPPHAVTVRTTVLQSGPGGGLTVALDGGFAVRSVRVTPVPGSGSVGIFTPAQPAPAPGPGLDVSLAGRRLSIDGTAQAPVLLPEGGTVTFDPATGAPSESSANDLHNWALDFTKAAQAGIPGASSTPTVGGILSAVSNVSIRTTSGTLDINTPQGRAVLVVHGPAGTAVPFDELASSVALTYSVRGGTGAYRGATGSGTVDVELTPVDQTVAGSVTGGIVTPSAAEGILTFTFNPGA